MFHDRAYLAITPIVVALNLQHTHTLYILTMTLCNLDVSAAANNRMPSIMTLFKTFSDTSSSFTTLAQPITLLLYQASSSLSSSPSLVNLGAEGIEELFSIFKVYNSILSKVYGV